MLIDARIKKLAIGLASGFLLVVAALLSAEPMYLMAVVVAIVPVISWIVGYVFASGMDCARQIQPTCSVHERVKVRVLMRNGSVFPKFFLRVADRLPRWLRFRGGEAPEGPLIPSLWAREEEEIVYYFDALKRGVYRIGPMRLVTSDPLGFSSYRKSLQNFAELVVYPEVLPIRPEFLDAGGGRGWQDQDSAQSRGAGTDFDGVREYRRGDELRRVNWKTTARTGTLAVNEYAQGYANSILVALDTNHAAYEDSGSGLESAFEYGVTIAASLCGAALRAGSPVSLVTCDDTAMASMPMRSIEHLPAALDLLAHAEPNSERPFGVVIQEALRQTRPGTLLIAVTPTGTDEGATRGACNEWSKGTMGSKITIFWLEKEEFHRKQQEHTRTILARKRKPAESIGTEEIASSIVQTRLGREFHIAPDGGMLRLLQGQRNV